MRPLILHFIAAILAGCATPPETPVPTAVSVEVSAPVPAAAFAPGEILTPMPWPPALASLSLVPVDTLHQTSTGPTLVNGFLADVNEWPATFFATLSNTKLAWNCTTTLVGPRVLLAAAHCVTDGGTVALRREGVDYLGNCERPNPGYPDPISNDWMLCAMDKPVPVFRYERISLNANLIKGGGKLKLGGGGCTVVGGTPDGQFRVGPATVDKLPGQYGGVAERNWIVTRGGIKTGESFICEGDSGGAVYFEPPDTNARFVVAVNSHRDTQGRGVAFLSAIYTSDAKNFIEAWRQRQIDRTNDLSGFSFCGIHTNDPQICR